MDGYIQTAIGIAVSVFLAVLGYRQTIGARKQRVVATNDTVIRAVLRRIISNTSSLNVADIQRLLEGKARENSVSEADLVTPSEVLTRIYAMVFDSDLVQDDQKKEIEDRVLQVARSEPENEHAAEYYDRAVLIRSRRFVDLISHTAPITVLASILGALITSLYSFAQSDTPLIPDISVDGLSSIMQSPIFFALEVFALSILVVASVLSFLRFRDRTELASSSRDPLAAVELEQKIAKELLRHNVTFTTAPNLQAGHRPDFLVHLENLKVVVEAKSWPERPSFALISSTLKQLNAIIESGAADRAVVITDKPCEVPSTLLTQPHASKILFTTLPAFVAQIK